MSDKLLEVEGESKNCYFVSPQIEAMVQTLEYVDSLRGREWTGKSQGTKSISREALMFSQQKDKLHLMVQIEEQSRMSMRNGS